MPLASIYFPSATYTQDDANALMADLAEVAAGFGYTTVHKSAERGNIRELLESIVGGEMALVLLADEERDAAIKWLQRYAETCEDYIAAQAFRHIAAVLTKARDREDE